MAAYAAVTSLMRTIHLISQPTFDLEEGDQELLKLLHEKASSLQDLLDHIDDEQTIDLGRKVADLAYEAEDQVESQVLLFMEKDEHDRTKVEERLRKILQQAIQDFDFVKEQLIKQRKNDNSLAGNLSIDSSSSPRKHVSTLENNMVGYNTEKDLLQDQLLGYSSQLEVISIYGMGGIGKSTFAKRMFYDPLVMSFFDVRGWVTVSKDYSLRNILLCLLQDTIGVKENLDNVTDGDLADRLQKSLTGRRYLIVVDDIWSPEAWDDIRLGFPRNSNQSRILLTTRDMKVAQYASSTKGLIKMRILEPDESWDLFCRKAFGENGCPIEFENVAEVVVENCKGLPLMISVIAGTLSSKTLDQWWKVAQSMSSLVNLDDYEHCSGVLALSYNHLPSHLKGCFLYLGVFTKASEISVKKLIRLWVAQGLVELKGLPEESEKMAANILHDLIDKSLVIVSKRGLAGKMKTCRIHDLLHDLCLSVSERENLLCVANPVTYEGPKMVSPQGRRWVSVQSTGCYDHSPLSLDDLSYSKTRSLHISSYNVSCYFELGLDHFKLLRVLDLELQKSHGCHVPSEILHLLSLRHLALLGFSVTDDLVISSLWNLQTLVVLERERHYRPLLFQDGFWEMSQLRHLHSTRTHLYSPQMVSAYENKYPILENLQSVSGLSPHCCTKQLFEGIKNLKKLGIFGIKSEFLSEPRCLDNILHLHELESLNIAAFPCDLSRSSFRLPPLSSFPSNLKELTLRETYLPLEDMTIISKLPKLEVLRLKVNSFRFSIPGERVWEVTEMGFPSLKFLLLRWLYLESWRATDDYFPCLERLVIKNCYFLEEIPEGFAYSVTLELIELHHCSPSLVHSAEQIQKEQSESSGNDKLKVYAFDTTDLDSDEDYGEAAE